LSVSKQSITGFPADLLIELDRSRPRGLRAQLMHGLRQAITRGSLRPGTALPASRVLAAELGVARSVVVESYQQLALDGYVEARQGSGTRVRAQRAGGSQGTDRTSATGSPAAPESAPYWPVPVGPDGRSPGSGLPDPALFPRTQWLRHYGEVLRELPGDSLLYPPPRGTAELRAALAAYLGRVRGVRAAADQIVICGGFSQGLVLLCRALRERGVTRVAVEEPCFRFHRLLIEASGLEAVGVPVDGQGLRTSLLAGLDAGAVLLSPAHSYPSGAVLSANRRVELLEWARESGVLVIEDDYDAELRYDRTPVGALQGLDPERVVYGGTVSKVLSPALRLGWLVAPPELTREIILARFFQDYSAEALGQQALARFIDSGDLARHLRRVRPVYRARRDRLLAALAAHLPGVRPQGEAAGLHLLLRLPDQADPDVVVAAAAAHGLMLENAAVHWADPATAPPALLVGYGAIREDAIARGIASLRGLT
jgi:GntR family transcriptional regulator/MocR family aminotransferase